MAKAPLQLGRQRDQQYLPTPPGGCSGPQQLLLQYYYGTQNGRWAGLLLLQQRQPRWVSWLRLPPLGRPRGPQQQKLLLLRRWRRQRLKGASSDRSFPCQQGELLRPANKENCSPANAGEGASAPCRLQRPLPLREGAKLPPSSSSPAVMLTQGRDPYQQTPLGKACRAVSPSRISNKRELLNPLAGRATPGRATSGVLARQRFPLWRNRCRARTPEVARGAALPTRGPLMAPWDT